MFARGSFSDVEYASNGTWGEGIWLSFVSRQSCPAYNVSSYCYRGGEVDYSGGSMKNVSWVDSWKDITKEHFYRAGLNASTWIRPYTYNGMVGFDWVGPLQNPSGTVVGVSGVTVTTASLGASLRSLAANFGSVLVFVVEIPSLHLISSSSSVFNQSILIPATESRDPLVANTTIFLNETGFPDQVTLHGGYFILSERFTLPGLNWRIITVQEIDCDAGYEVGADNMTWCVSR